MGRDDMAQLYWRETLLNGRTDPDGCLRPPKLLPALEGATESPSRFVLQRAEPVRREALRSGESTAWLLLDLGGRRVESGRDRGEGRRGTVPSQLLCIVKKERDVGPERRERSEQQRAIALLRESTFVGGTPNFSIKPALSRTTRFRRSNCRMRSPHTHPMRPEAAALQTPGLIVMILELDSTHRQIYTQGRRLPADPEPFWRGYSLGRWEGETRVVETAGFNDKPWLDGMGHPHSEAMQVVELYGRRDFGHMDEKITTDDPKMFTRPFTIKVTHLLEVDSDISGILLCRK
jgi:hypothetical protein